MTNGDVFGPQTRKLRLGVMGEFSAGKSTLCNLLLGDRPLTERVTATRLSPVWITRGAPALEREFLDGTRVPLALSELESVPIKDTRSIRLYNEADVLDLFDLIDFPGISDPNMPTDVWERLVPEMDAVLWCTHANQAWRQSEAEVWREIPQDVQERSLLLITRFDTITNERDRARVLGRVRQETNGSFAAIFPISLTQALSAEDDAEAWAESGAEPFTTHLVDLIAELQTQLEIGEIAERAPAFAPRPQTEPVVARDPGATYGAAPADETPVDDQTANEFSMQSAPEPARPSLRLPRASEPEPAPEPAATRPGPDDAFATAGLPEDDFGSDFAAEVTERFSDDFGERSEAEAVAAAPEAVPAPQPVTEPERAEPAPKTRSPISLLSRRGGAPADASAAPSVLPRRVKPTGLRRTERPREETGVRAMRMDDSAPEEVKSAKDLRAALSQR